MTNHVMQPTRAIEMNREEICVRSVRESHFGVNGTNLALKKEEKVNRKQEEYILS